MQIFLIVAAFCGLCFLLWIGRERGTYQAGRNPAQRSCVDCGQLQWAYCTGLDGWDEQWWETAHEIIDPTCKCHKDVK